MLTGNEGIHKQKEDGRRGQCEHNSIDKDGNGCDVMNAQHWFSVPKQAYQNDDKCGRGSGGRQ